MNTSEFREWLRSDDGIAAEISELRRWSARRAFGEGVIESPDNTHEREPAWQRLLLASSILAESDQRVELEVAVMVAQAALVFGEKPILRDAGAVILSQLANRRTVDMAVQKEIIAPNLSGRLGVTEMLLNTRRAIETTITINEKSVINGSEFQFDLWSKLTNSDWTSATAPTAAGKTYLVLNWLLSEFENKRSKLAVFLAPTRALVGEIEKQIIEMSEGFSIPSLRVASLPMKQLGDATVPTILVLTQERLHLFFNAFDDPPAIQIAIVDEAQKLNDGSRGVILQDAIERVVRANSDCKFVFLTPHAKNPEALLDDAPKEITGAVVPGITPTVTQNLLLARQVFRKPQKWELTLFEDQDTKEPVGTFSLHEKHDGSVLKKLSFTALALGKDTSGTLIYANRAGDAEKIAFQIYDGLIAQGKVSDAAQDEELQDLSDFCRSAIHNRFLLVKLVKAGVAFHYGNMPTILRNEIERLFRNGKIRFLVCTSTLIEGVNLACRTIIMRGPRKGVGTHMSPQDFWNLAGRAGRWGADFHGNIVCVDPHIPDAWPKGVPAKTAYPVERETDTVLQSPLDIAQYVKDRKILASIAHNERFEPVSAYLMAWHTRNGTILDAPSVKRADNDDVVALEEAIKEALSEVSIPQEIVNAHPGITAISMQSLLAMFEKHTTELELLLPPYPGDDDIVLGLKQVFERIDQTLAPAFGNDGLQWAAAYITRDWIRGKKLGFMINGAIRRERDKNPGEINYAKIIRDTMKFVEEFARFKAPKYLAAYLDILRFHYERCDRIADFPTDLPFDLYLEFGVSTSTLLSFLGLGLSRTSSIEISDFLARDDLDEQQAFDFLASEEWESLDIPNLVKREIRELVKRHDNMRIRTALQS
ncbi:DEAD/DEAH box helicase [Parasphingorhabdus sp. DH2-15]|uniref:DEAD/DEAH box helicase n=1 Tax=Parasphingorhabdus sp. DH2-15 TaxID=3444112 RepID=UPI003F687ADD